MKNKLDQGKVNLETYFTIDDCLNWLASNKYSNIGMEYTYQRIAQLINDFIEVENLSTESIERELNTPRYNAQINMYTYMKSLERYLGDFIILINVLGENGTYYTTDTSVPPRRYAKTKADVSRYLVNKNFIRALDFYLEEYYFHAPSHIVFKTSKDIFIEIKDFDQYQLIAYVDAFIQDLLNIIRLDTHESLEILRNQEMSRLNVILDKYRLMVDSPNDQVIDQCYFLMEITQNAPIIVDTWFDKFKTIIRNDIHSDHNFENESMSYSKQMNRFLRDFDKVYNSKADDQEYVLLNREEFTEKLEKALKKREFGKYIDYFYMQSRMLRNKMNEAIKE